MTMGKETFKMPEGFRPPGFLSHSQPLVQNLAIDADFDKIWVI